jgi:hypothetical protein
MMQQLMAELEKGGTIRPLLLAKRLGISVNMVEAMLEDLVRLGLLREVSMGCGDPCKGCPLAGSCSQPAQSHLWQLVPRAH